jgi:hypothetical protein
VEVRLNLLDIDFERLHTVRLASIELPDAASLHHVQAALRRRRVEQSASACNIGGRCVLNIRLHICLDCIERVLS